MSLEYDDLKEEDRGILGRCGILCSGCDYYIGEGFEAAKKIIDIWEGWNIIDVGSLMGLDPKGIKNTLKTLHKYIKFNKERICPGCPQGSPSSKICSISKCVETKGYWTCAECKDYNPESDTPCPHVDSNAIPITDKGQFMKMIYKRYSQDPVQNLKNCREIGYLEFIKDAKEKVAKGWRTWQVISKQMVFTNQQTKK